MNYRNLPLTYWIQTLLLAVPLAMHVSFLFGVEEISNSQAVEAARDTLTDVTTYPWYDAQKDSIHRIDVHPQAELEASVREPNWENEWDLDLEMPAFNWGGLWDILSAVCWVGFGGLMLGLIAALIWAFSRADILANEDGNLENGGETALDEQMARIENLPFILESSRTDLLAEVQRHATAGDFRTAIIYLFSYQLVYLDRHQMIRLRKGKTNRQYLNEVRKNLSLRKVLEQTMFVFEDVFFGDHPIDRRQFESCWKNMDEFHSQVEQVVTS